MITVTDEDVRAPWDWLGFVRRQMRLIIGGTSLVVAVMIAVTLSMPSMYRATAVIDTGTVGVLHGNDIDDLDHQFNAGRYRKSLTGLEARASIHEVWAQFYGSAVVVQVEATDGRAAAEAARRVARRLADAFNTIPLLLPAPPITQDPPEMAPIRASLVQVSRDVDGRLERHTADVRRLKETNETTVRALRKAVADRAAQDRLQRLVGQLATGVADYDREIDRLAGLQAIRAQLQLALTLPPSQKMLDALEAAAARDASDAPSLRAEAKQVDSILTRQGQKLPPTVRRAAVSRWPTVPEQPTWPNAPINLLVAFIFGLIGSTFVAALRDSAGRDS